jgi:hypothetical protein
MSTMNRDLNSSNTFKALSREFYYETTAWKYEFTKPCRSAAYPTIRGRRIMLTMEDRYSSASAVLKTMGR